MQSAIFFFCGSLFLLLAGLVGTADGAPSTPNRDETHLQNPRPQHRNCTNDAECLESEFCRTKTLSPICVSCIDCAGVHKRLAKFRCARSRRECGDCIQGYTEIRHSVTEFTCKETSDLLPKGQSTDDGHPESTFISRNSTGMWAPAVVFLIVGVLTIGALVYVGRRFSPVIFRQQRPLEENALAELEPSSSCPQNSPSDTEIQLLKCNVPSMPFGLESPLAVLPLFEKSHGVDAGSTSGTEKDNIGISYDESFYTPEEPKLSNCSKQTASPCDRGAVCGNSVSQYQGQVLVPSDPEEQANNDEVDRLFQEAIVAQTDQTFTVAPDPPLREDSFNLEIVAADEMDLEPYLLPTGSEFVSTWDLAPRDNHRMSDGGDYAIDFSVEEETTVSRSNTDEDQVVPQIPDGSIQRDEDLNLSINCISFYD